MTVFYRSLATMFTAGIPLNRALEMLSRQLDEPRLRAACADLTRRIESGVGLDLAMASHPDLFGTLEVNLVTLGMRTGQLAMVLVRVADYAERTERLSRQVWAALTYPLVTLAMCLVMLAVAPPLVLNALLPLLRSSGVELPWLSQGLVLFSAFLTSPWFWVVTPVGVWLLLRMGRRLFRRPAVRLAWHRFLLGRGGLGPLLQTLAVTRFARALVLAQEAGVPVHQSLPLAALASGDPVLQEASPGIVGRLLDGSTLDEALAGSGFFPPLFLAAIVAGQESGRPGQTLGRLADIYEVELEARFELLASLLAPVVTVLLGSLVAVLNLALLLPLMKLLQTL